MTGDNLKLILLKTGIQLKDIAEKLEMSQQNFSNALKVSDVKTGLLERLCDVLNVGIEFFYRGTKYSQPSVIASGVQSIATGIGDVTVGTQNENNSRIGVQNNYGGSIQDKQDSLSTLTETVSTLTRELETSQQQKSSLIEVVATSQKQIIQLTDMVDRLTTPNNAL